MKKLLLFAALAFITFQAGAQCTTNNATGCKCRDTSQTDCDLLPDIQIGHPPFYMYGDTYGVVEYPQSGNSDPNDDGKLYVTVSTPNTGHGPLEIYPTDTFVCGVDTFYGTPPAICPDGITYPKVLIMQRIYHKNGNAMSSYVRPAGTMTYHPTHSHMHVDNWGNYTIRSKDTLDPNPLNWPIIGAGTKLAFCVEDYGTCQGYPGHCLDSLGNPMNSSSDFPNYGLGGGNYNCSPTNQGISSGYVDIYWTTLAGMYIQVPPGLCNQEVYIVCEVDPNQFFLEEDEDNNVYAAPYVLQMQLFNPETNNFPVSVANSMRNLCQGESVSLSVQSSEPGLSYLWSNGDTTQFTQINTSGTYTVDVSNSCGTGTSVPITINVNSTADPAGINDTIPVPGQATLQANSPYTVYWYDMPAGGSPIDTGNAFVTPFLNTSTTFYAEATQDFPGDTFHTGLADNTVFNQGSYSTADQALIFDCYSTFILSTVNVYSQSGGNVTVVLRDSGNTILQSKSFNLVSGMNTITLDFTINPGTGYQLGRSSGSMFRNNPNTNVGYPFVLDNVCSITGTTAGSGFYYFYYDWVVKLPDHTCTSGRVPVEAIVSAPNTIADVSVIHSFRMYPNPASKEVRVSFYSEDQHAKCNLVDALGKTVIQLDLNGDGGFYDELIPLSSLSRGIYHLHLLSSGKNFYRRLVVD